MDELRRQAGLLSPTEIKEKRTKLALTQAQLASYLKVAESTVCRWERGGQIQQRAMDLLLRAFFSVPQMQQFLGFSGSSDAPTAEQFAEAGRGAVQEQGR
jgi:transcriptional regulator with XRE-family HTH domain